jgi:hypothetical protein
MFAGVNPSAVNCDSSHGHEALRDHDGHDALQVSDAARGRDGLAALAHRLELIPPGTTSTSSSFYSKANFDQAKQDKYKAAVANAAGTAAANVDIVSITEARRRAESVKVETKVGRLRVRESCP